MPFFDTHAHLTSDSIYPILDTVIENAKKNEVEKIINICTDELTLNRGFELTAKHPWIKTAAATTPHDVEKEGERVFPSMESAAKEKKLIAIGETGLDYYYEHSNKKIQQKFLVKYLHLAQETNLPVIIHCREAFEDLFSIVDLEYDKKAKLILHCFTGSLTEAEKVLQRGWFLSLSGIVTFKKSLNLQEVAKMVPLNSLLIETDSPYLAPQSQRGKQNEPMFIKETASFIAQLKNLSSEELNKHLYENACRAFEEK